MLKEVFCIDKSTIFQKMLRQSELLLDQEFTEYSVVHCHVTLDYFINLFLELSFLTELTPIRDTKRDIHKLFIEATWEQEGNNKYIGFMDKFGKYTRTLGFDFKGRNEYSELKRMNDLRNKIIHNRAFASDIPYSDAQNFIQLGQSLLELFRNAFTSDSIFLSCSNLSKEISFIDQNFKISASKGNDKNTELVIETNSLFHANERSGVLIPEDIGFPSSSRFRSFSLRICGIEYSRYGTDKADKISALQNLEPQWFNGQALSILINLNFHEVARNVEEALINYQENIKNIIEDIVLRQLNNLLGSWEATDFVNQVMLSRAFSSLFNLSYLSESPNLKSFLINEWSFLSVVAEENEWSYLTLSEINGIEEKAIVVHTIESPAEMDFIRRFVHTTNFLEENILVFIPEGYPFFWGIPCEHNSILIEFIKGTIISSEKPKEVKKLDKNDLDFSGEYFRFPLGGIFSVGSQYDRYIVNNPALHYICEKIKGVSYINREHHFSQKIIEFAESANSGNGEKVYSFLETINDALDGRRWHFSDFADFKVKLSKLLVEIGFPDHENFSQSVTERDLPPGFFVWENKYNPESIVKMD